MMSVKELLEYDRMKTVELPCGVNLSVEDGPDSVRYVMVRNLEPSDCALDSDGDLTDIVLLMNAQDIPKIIALLQEVQEEASDNQS